MTDIKKGDFVTVTIRGEVSEVNNRDIVVGPFAGFGCTILPRKAEGHEVQVAVVEPPAEVFKPGDVVRSKRGSHVYFIRKRGFINLTDGSAKEWDTPFEFTSEYYEKVPIE